jgi:hypothetical protein
MTKTHLAVVFSAAALISSAYMALAGQTIESVGHIVCATDKWDEKELEKGHKIVDASSRCVLIPDDSTAPKLTDACAGKYEYLADGSWNANGTCTETYPGGDKVFLDWEEGSHLSDYTWTNTGGTGKYDGASGSGTYKYENLTDTLVAGRYKGKLMLP